MINTCAEAVELIGEIGHPNLRVHLDTYHMNIEEDGLAAPVEAAGDLLGYVHIGESHRGTLGSGNVNFGQFFDALAEARYEGVLTFESFSTRVVSPTLSNTLCIWRDLWDDSEVLAKEAREFIRVQSERPRA